MGATKDQALMIQRRSLKRWGIWRTQFLKKLLSILRIWIRNDVVIDEADDEDERRILPMKKIKISTQLSFHDIVLLCICLYLVDDRLFSLMTSILLICMWGVSSPWYYTTLHCHLSRMKPLCWHIGLVHNLNIVLIEMEGI